MRKLMFVATALAVGFAAQSAAAAEAVTIQLKWVTQAQFAGYYVAQDKGFYGAENLDVTINPGGPDISPPQIIVGGGADVIIDWMPSALASREKGVPLVNIAQPFKRSGMMLTCRKDTGISGPEDFAGKTLGVWFFGNEYPFLSWMSKLGLSTQGGEGVTVLKQGFNVYPILQRQADCVSTMEDGLYVLEDNLKDPAFVDRMARFVRATMKGWDWARANPKEAALIVLENDNTGAQTEKHQIRMMGEINKLTAGSNGRLDPADFDRTVNTLLSGGSDPVITKVPTGAWTHAITDAAGLM